MPLKILIVSNFYPPAIVGGAEIVAHRHARLLKARGWEVSVFAGAIPTASHRSGTLAAYSIDGIEVLSLAHRSLDPAENFRWPLANRILQSILSSSRPDIVHFHNVTGLGVDLVRIAEEAGIRTAVTLHDHWGYCFKNTRLREDESICMNIGECHLCKSTIEDSGSVVPMRLRRDYVVSRLEKADLLISPSEYLAKCYECGSLNLGSVIAQSNGIDLEAIPSRIRRPNKCVEFLCAAYLGEHKGIPVLLDAVKILEGRSELEGRWALTIAGHGHLKATVEAFLAKLSTDTPVTFAGRLRREEMMRALDDADVIVLPSVWPENEPVILLEGVAAGAAVLATAVGGNSHIVITEKSGLLVPQGNAAALADAMARLILSPDLVTAMSEYNLARRRFLDQARSVDKLSALFESPLPIRRRRDDIVICTGQSSLESLQAIATLEMALDGLPPRLIWKDWADASDWASAKAYWCWDKAAGLKDVSDALAWGLPIILPQGPFSQSLRQIGHSIEEYREWHELWRALAVKCNGQGKGRKVEFSGLLRFAARLAPMENFRLMVEE